MTTLRLALLTTLAAAAVPGGALCATFTVNSGAADMPDGDLSDGLCSVTSVNPKNPSPGACTLRAAVMQANALGGFTEVILDVPTVAVSIPGLEMGPFDGSGPVMVNQPPTDEVGDLDITAAIAIRSAGSTPATIQGAGNHRLFDVHGSGQLGLGSVVVRGGRIPECIYDNLVLYCEEPAGGAVRVQSGGSLFTMRARFEDNEAVLGGAVAGSGGNLELLDSTFEDNRAVAYSGLGSVPPGQIPAWSNPYTTLLRRGGAVHAEWSRLNLYRSTFDHNSSGDRGGAVHTLLSSVLARGTSFTDNTAGDCTDNQIGWGGGMFVDGGDAYIDGASGDGGTSVFTSNTVCGRGGGGGVYARGRNATGRLEVRGARFEGNNAGGDGAGLLANALIDLEAHEASFLHNVAGDDAGGLDALNVGEITIQGGLFDDNTGTDQGGGLRVRNAASLSVVGTEFLTNHGVRHGGGAYIANVAVATLEGVRFDKNVAQRTGAGVDSRGTTLNVIGATFHDNGVDPTGMLTVWRGGGLANWSGGAVSLDGCDFTENESLRGAAVYNDAGLSISGGSSFDRNGGAATRFGGAIANWTNGTLTIGNASLTDNDALSPFGAGGDGAGIYNEGMALLQPGSGGLTITGNQALDAGGALFNRGTVTITDIDLVDNHASVGAGLFQSETGSGPANAALYNVGVVDNTAVVSGGGIAVTGGVLEANHCTLVDNGAPGGGGLHVTGGEVDLNHCTVKKNGGSTGAGLFVEGGTTTVTRCSIVDNDAMQDGAGARVNGGELLVSDSTVAGNTVLTVPTGASSWTAGISVEREGYASLVHTTVIDNEGPIGGISYVIPMTGGIDLESSVVSGNTSTISPSFDNCAEFGGIESLGCNVVDLDPALPGCDLGQPAAPDVLTSAGSWTRLIEVDALGAPLPGGEYVELSSSSPAYGLVDPAGCTSSSPEDQLGTPRTAGPFTAGSIE